MSTHTLNYVRVSFAARLAFTLMEVLLVLVILVILASLAVPIYNGIQVGVRKDAARTQVGLLKNSINMYQLHTSAFPDNLNSLVARPSDPKLSSKWRGPYIEALPNDPWDNPYRIAVPGTHNPDSFDVWSTGPDGQDGTADDIGNWQ